MQTTVLWIYIVLLVVGYDWRAFRNMATQEAMDTALIAHAATLEAVDQVVAGAPPDDLNDLARVGTVLELEPGHEALAWYGRGPVETYPDRHRAGTIEHGQCGHAAELQDLRLLSVLVSNLVARVDQIGEG